MTNEEAKVFLDNLKICIDEHPIVADWLVEIADRKTEPSGYKMKPIEQTEPQIRLDKDNKTLWIKNTLDGYDRVIVEEDVFCRIFYEDCGECAHNKTEPQTNERLKRLQACIDCEHTDMCEWCHTRWSKTEQTEREDDNFCSYGEREGK